MTVKRKTVLQFGVALLSIGIAAIPGGSRISDKVVFAEELSAFESDDGFTSAAPEDAAGQSSTEDFTTSEPENNAENTGDYNVLTKINDIIATATYSEQSTNITDSSKINLDNGTIFNLAQ